MGQSLPAVQIRSSAEADAAAFRDLRLEALRLHPEAFGADYAQSASEPLSFWAERARAGADNSEQAIHFAVVDDRLVGMCGIRRGGSPKTRHAATIWGVYLRSEWRGRRVVDSLINASLDWARHQQLHLVKLTVVVTNIAAIRCYHRCGFTVYGVEPQALFVNGQFYDELLMVKQLRPPAEMPIESRT